MKKVGHGGTLDPDVEGVLPICLGKGTKVIEYLTDSGKEYIGEITLGKATTTEDASGEIIAEKRVVEPFSDQEVDEAMKKMVGNITQVPPMYSAVKVNGHKLYEYARAGKEVERPQRIVLIKSYRRIDATRFNSTEGTFSWRFAVECGKGTYIRTLAVDTGKLLNFPAYMSNLERTASGGFHRSDCLNLSQVKKEVEAGTMAAHIYPIEFAVQGFQRKDLTTTLFAKVKNGVFLSAADFENYDLDEPVALFYEDRLISLYKLHPGKKEWLKPIKVFRIE